MIHLTDEFKLIEILLNNYGFKHAVVGGYPRDLFFGKEPKDLDIIVADSDANVENWLRLITELTKHNLLVAHHENEAEPSSTGDDRVVEVLTCKGGIDIIWWNLPTLIDIVDNFDYNLNQFVLCDQLGKRKPLYAGDYYTFGTLTQIQKNGYIVPQLRVEKMEPLAEQFKWKVIPCQKNKRPFP